MHNGDSLLGFSDTSHPIYCIFTIYSSFSECCFLLYLLFFSPLYIVRKGPELTWTWVETMSYCLAMVHFGICWASIFESIFSTCVGELLLAVASKRVTHVFSHASIGVWLVSRGRLAPLLSTTCSLNWCQPVCHCVCIVAVVEELLSHSSQCWCLLLISAPFEELTSLTKSHAASHAISAAWQTLNFIVHPFVVCQ